MLEFEEMDNSNEYVGKLDLCLNTTEEHFTVRSSINREKKKEKFNKEFTVLRRDKIIKYKKKTVMENSIDEAMPKSLYLSPLNNVINILQATVCNQLALNDTLHLTEFQKKRKYLQLFLLDLFNIKSWVIFYVQSVDMLNNYLLLINILINVPAF